MLDVSHLIFSESATGRKPAAKTMRPTKGKTINYVLENGAVRPAIITDVWDGPLYQNGEVNLTVFVDPADGFDRPVVSVPCVPRKDPVISPDAESTTLEFHTWHWPQRV